MRGFRPSLRIPITQGQVRRWISTQTRTDSGRSWRRALEVFHHRCAYCNRAGHLQRDHVVPTSKGGPTSPRNIVPACDRCNASKSNLPVQVWMRQMGYSYELFLLRWMQLWRE